MERSHQGGKNTDRTSKTESPWGTIVQLSVDVTNHCSHKTSRRHLPTQKTKLDKAWEVTKLEKDMINLLPNREGLLRQLGGYRGCDLLCLTHFYFFELVVIFSKLAIV